MKTDIDKLKTEAETANLRREDAKTKSRDADSRTLWITPYWTRVRRYREGENPAR
jgi:hypothetical protein